MPDAPEAIPSADYVAKMEREIALYREVEDVHDLPPIHHYWAERYVRPKFRELGLDGKTPFLIDSIGDRCRQEDGRTVEIVSIGAGNCDQEASLATNLMASGVQNFRIDCLDINLDMLDRGRKMAEARGVRDKLGFVETDIKDWTGADRRYAICLAFQSLHHFVELETLFRKVRQALSAGGIFFVDEMIGRNGHMRWPEAGVYVREIWRRIPASYKYNHQLDRLELDFEDRDCSTEGFEGIRAQDILPLLLEFFHFELFIAFGNVIDLFVDRSFGPNLSPKRGDDRAFIDQVAQLDDQLIDEGIIKPTHLFARLRTQPAQDLKCYRNRTPEHCVRWPDAMPPQLNGFSSLCPPVPDFAFQD
jgi:SAM-dependent methyltransferase